MKATGIVRRVDDLGRVVIPREIRRTMGIRDGEPMEIFIEGTDTVCFQKYERDLPGAIDRLHNELMDYVDTDKDTLRRISMLMTEVRELVKASEEEEE